MTSNNFVFTRRVSRFAIVSLAAFLPLFAAEGPTLPSAQQQFSVPGTFTHARTFPTVSGGYLVAFSRTIRPDNPSNIVLTSLTNGKQQAVPFTLPGTTSIMLYDVTVTGDQHVLLTGEFTTATTTGVSQFIVETDMTGHVNKVIDVGDYSPEHICAASDGTFWTLGQVWKQETVRGNYDFIRNYSANGTLKASYLPRTSMRPQLVDFYPPGSTFGNGSNQAFLSCNGSTLGLYLGYPSNTWTQINPATGAISRWKIGALPTSKMTGLAVTAGDAVYASFEFQNGKGGARGLYTLTTAPNHTASWVPVADPSGAGHPFSILLGESDTGLVYLRGPKPPVADPTIYFSLK